MNNTYERGSCKDNDSTMKVRQNSVEYWESGFTSVNTRIQTWYEHTNRGLKETRHKVFEVEAKCSGEGSNWNATLLADPSATSPLCATTPPRP
jgi:hypothetical protein